MTVYGPLSRTVSDAALFLDATADGGPDGGYLAALGARAAQENVLINLPSVADLAERAAISTRSQQLLTTIATSSSALSARV